MFFKKVRYLSLRKPYIEGLSFLGVMVRKVHTRSKRTYGIGSHKNGAKTMKMKDRRR